MILGVVEHDRGTLNELSLEMLTCGRRLAAALGVPLHAALVGAAARPLAERLAAYGVSTVHVVEHTRLDDYAPAAWAEAVAAVVAAEHPRAVLAAGSDRGHEVLAHVAARARLPMAANCTEIAPGEPWRVTRQRWGGSLLEDARLDGAVALCTIAPHAVPAEAAPAAAPLAIRTVSPGITDAAGRARITARTETGRDTISLADARVVVGGGRGVGSAEGFKALEELAALLGGAVGCSRAVTSLGWRAHADQVGQTGTRIAPDLYIACGISGAIQHMIGCTGAKRILAINTDPEATIVAKAHYAVVADLHRVVPAVNAALREVAKHR